MRNFIYTENVWISVVHLQSVSVHLGSLDTYNTSSVEDITDD